MELTYRQAQRIWLKVNHVHIGARVRIVRPWSTHESGFQSASLLLDAAYLELTTTITDICHGRYGYYDCIELKLGNSIIPRIIVPFFVLKLIK